MFFFHRRGVGGGKIRMENSITFNVFCIETFPKRSMFRITHFCFQEFCLIGKVCGQIGIIKLPSEHLRHYNIVLY